MGVYVGDIERPVVGQVHCYSSLMFFARNEIMELLVSRVLHNFIIFFEDCPFIKVLEPLNMVIFHTIATSN